MKSNQVLQRANELLNERVDELESEQNNKNISSNDVLSQLEQIKTEYFQFKKKVSDTLMLSKENKILQETNGNLVNKINKLEIKNEDLINKCKLIENESSLQLANLRGKITELSALNDNQYSEIVHLKNKLHDSQNDELLQIKSKFIEELQIKNTALNDKISILNSIIDELNNKNEKFKLDYQKTSKMSKDSNMEVIELREDVERKHN